ncbi:MAG: esterase family protein, partial [Planctomycetaceae bacterium]
MRPAAPIRLALLALSAALVVPFSAAPTVAQDVDHDRDYVLSATSTARGEGVAAGSTRMVVHASQGVFPGTVRRVWVHLPAESVLKTVGDEGLAVMVFQDGHAYVDEAGQFRVPIVLDNLVHAGRIPPMAAIFVDPGHTGG